MAVAAVVVMVVVVVVIVVMVVTMVVVVVVVVLEEATVDVGKLGRERGWKELEGLLSLCCWLGVSRVARFAANGRNQS